jgi:hypothetical protein
MTEIKKDTNATGAVGKNAFSQVRKNNAENKATTSCCNAPSKETSSCCPQIKTAEKTTV